MKKNFTLIVLFLFAILTFSQNVNLEEIKKNISNPSSDFYLEKIITKYKGLPSQLDSIEARHLYYGKASSVDIKKSNEIRENFKKEDYKTALEIAESILKENPTDLETLSIISECYYRLQDSNNLNYYSTQFRKLIDAVLSSGDGKTEKTAYLANSVTYEYILLAILQKKAFEMKRFSKPSKDGMYDVWDDNGKKLYISIIYNMKF